MIYDYIRVENGIEVMHKLLYSLVEFASEVEKHTKDGWRISEQHQPMMIGFNYGLWMVREPKEEVKEEPKVEPKVESKTEEKTIRAKK